MRNLKNYLRFAVLGETEHARKPRRRPRIHRRGPVRDWRYRAWIRTLPCAACGSTHQVEAAHTGTDGGMRQKASDRSCVPACHDCHQAASGALHRNGSLWLGIDLAGLVSTLNATYSGMAEYLRGQE